MANLARFCGGMLPAWLAKGLSCWMLRPQSDRRLSHPRQRQIRCTSQQSRRLLVSISFYLIYNQVDCLYIPLYVANRLLYISSCLISCRQYHFIFSFSALSDNDHVYNFDHFCIVMSGNEKRLPSLGSSIQKNKVICTHYKPQAPSGRRSTGGHRDT
jgi:hypothetical protein